MLSLGDFERALGKDFVKLIGPENYEEWFTDFFDIAYINGYRDFYLGTEPILEKPERPYFITERATHSEAPANWQYLLAVYKIQLRDWKDNNENARSACALLRAAVEPWIWNELSSDDTTSPQNAWKAIVATHCPPDDVRVARLLRKLDIIKLDDATALRPFLAQFEEVYNAIQRANGTFTRNMLFPMIHKALPRQYNTFIKLWNLTHSNVYIDDKLFKKYRSLLLEHADRNKAHWQAAEERGAPWGNDSANRSNDRITSDRPMCDYCGNFGHYMDDCRYLGRPDTPRCSFCNKLGHEEDICRKKQQG
ncbi:hypothetical protein N0V83_010487 [Neocucurbitaria cava]|uniref:CCHC-type domain-containing protein n=1 Tax=Neocucurbitaria cava TaxID=798079 RepID=A0A9W8Y0R0_9PLEO|nr:hypothetical protein N0V83_010487 [Neocucurbitaria cava]